MIYCSQCGEEMEKVSKYCSSCGNGLGNNTDEGVGVQGQDGVNASVFAILGWVFNGIAIILVPILFAGGGVIFGYLHRKVNQTHGTIIMIAAVVCGLFGMVLGLMAAGY